MSDHFFYGEETDIRVRAIAVFFFNLFFLILYGGTSEEKKLDVLSMPISDSCLPLGHHIRNINTTQSQKS